MAAFTITSMQLNAQTTFALASASEFNVSGTSTIHDWKMTSATASGEATITVIGNKLTGIETLKVSMVVRTLKSGKGQMDNNAYKALKADKYPVITLELIEVLTISYNKIKASGKLTIAGTTKLVTVETEYNLSGNSITISGLVPITFTQFNIEPPTAVFGTIKTGDDLQLSFNLTFRPTNKITKS